MVPASVPVPVFDSVPVSPESSATLPALEPLA
jgi:hypothetical protein